LSNAQRKSNRKKSSVRSRVEHCFFVMKRQFGFTKLRYKGLAKNAHFLFVSCALVNLVMAKKTLMKKQWLTARAA
jgi:transposase, IS5 family